MAAVNIDSSARIEIPDSRNKRDILTMKVELLNRNSVIKLLEPCQSLKTIVEMSGDNKKLLSKPLSKSLKFK